MSMFEVLPAIDLRGGRVVRLEQGDFERETSYGDDPVAVAMAFAQAGATWLHVVDLDGAVAGEPRQLDLAATIAGRVGDQVRVEAGGGMRTAQAVAAAFDTGVARVALGTALIRDASLATSLVSRFGSGRIAASIDVRDGQAVGDGWRSGTQGVPAAEAVTALAARGISTFEVTAIERDGLLAGPDLGLLRSLVALDCGRIIASGGMSSIGDVLAAREAGCDGAIIGRAIYEGTLDLRALVRALGSAAGQ
jgi:phosphoribosylformimino-5-aminoimidazole carboxamide ribotide isomerase